MQVPLAFLGLKYHYDTMNKENIQDPKSTKSKEVSPKFEVAMVELEELVLKIEAGDLSLEDSLKEFEKGIKLSRTCQKALTDAEQRVKILSNEGEEDFIQIPE